MDLKILKVDSKNNDFKKLIKLLDADLDQRYGELQKQYTKHNYVDYIKDAIIIYKEEVAVACGAFKEYDSNTAELKRIFVRKENRQQGLSKIVIKELEELIRSSGYQHILLETGIKQYEAIILYKNAGYNIIQNYEPYTGNLNSICMKKDL